MSIEVTCNMKHECTTPCPHEIKDRDGDIIKVGTMYCTACSHRLEPMSHRGFINCGLGDYSSANSKPNDMNIMEFM